MKIKNMSFQDLNVLFGEVKAITEIDYPDGTVDVDEVWHLYGKIKNEIKNREKNIKDNDSIICHYYIFWTYDEYVACRINNIVENNYCVATCFIYNREEEECKLIDSKLFNDIYDYFMLYQTDDKRLGVCFHDDYGGNSYAKEITKEDFIKITNTPLIKLEEEFESLDINSIESF